MRPASKSARAATRSAVGVSPRMSAGGGAPCRGRAEVRAEVVGLLSAHARDHRGEGAVRAVVAIYLDGAGERRLGHHAPERPVVVLACGDGHRRARGVDLCDPQASRRQEPERHRLLGGHLVDQPREVPTQHVVVVVVGRSGERDAHGARREGRAEQAHARGGHRVVGLVGEDQRRARDGRRDRARDVVAQEDGVRGDVHAGGDEGFAVAEVGSDGESGEAGGELGGGLIDERARRDDEGRAQAAAGDHVGGDDGLAGAWREDDASEVTPRGGAAVGGGERAEEAGEVGAHAGLVGA
jgi:hypothetical protein